MACNIILYIVKFPNYVMILIYISMVYNQMHKPKSIVNNINPYTPPLATGNPGFWFPPPQYSNIVYIVYRSRRKLRKRRKMSVKTEFVWKRKVYLIGWYCTTCCIIAGGALQLWKTAYLGEGNPDQNPCGKPTVV